MGTPILAHGAGHLFTYFPLLFIVAAVCVIVIALRDGAGKNGATRLPTSPLSRQVWMATRRQRRSTAERAATAVPSASAERAFRRMGAAPTLQVMEGEGGDGKVIRIPKTFEPPPPTRRRA